MNLAAKKYIMIVGSWKDYKKLISRGWNQQGWVNKCFEIKDNIAMRLSLFTNQASNFQRLITTGFICILPNFFLTFPDFFLENEVIFPDCISGIHTIFPDHLAL